MISHLLTGLTNLASLPTILLMLFGMVIGMLVGMLVTDGVALADDLPRAGAFSGTYTSFGTIKATPVGKDRLLFVFDEDGLLQTDGFSDKARMHCWLLGDYTNGEGQEHGLCLAIDPSGDQTVSNVITAKHKLGNHIQATATFAGGTGKYAGITGSSHFSLDDTGHPSQTNYLLNGPVKGTYKLP